MSQLAVHGTLPLLGKAHKDSVRENGLQVILVVPGKESLLLFQNTPWNIRVKGLKERDTDPGPRRHVLPYLVAFVFHSKITGRKVAKCDNPAR